MDTFVEQIVEKREGGKEWAIIGGLVLALLVVVILLLWFLGLFSLIFIAGAGYGAWWLITSQNVEFEYSVTNGDIDIDQITAKRKRKRIVSVSGEKIESMQLYRPEEFANRPFDRTVVAAPSTMEESLWCFSYHSKKNGHTLVIFQPEERVFNALKGGLPKLVQMDIDRKMRQQSRNQSAESTEEHHEE